MFCSQFWPSLFLQCSLPNPHPAGSYINVLKVSCHHGPAHFLVGRRGRCYLWPPDVVQASPSGSLRFSLHLYQPFKSSALCHRDSAPATPSKSPHRLNTSTQLLSWPEQTFSFWFPKACTCFCFKSQMHTFPCPFFLRPQEYWSIVPLIWNWPAALCSVPTVMFSGFPGPQAMPGILSFTPQHLKYYWLQHLTRCFINHPFTYHIDHLRLAYS